MAKLRYPGERDEAAPYLTDLGWALDGVTIRDLLAANDFPPLQNGDLRYVSGVLDHATK